MESTAEVAAKTCKVTLVQPGSSDRVIKVYPAEQEAEKIWLDTAPGIARWEEVKRLIYTCAERGTRAPDPVPYHSSVSDLKTPSITERDIPLVRLENAILKAPPREQTVGDLKLPAQVRAEAHEARLEKLEAVVGQLSVAINSFMLAQQRPQAPAAAAFPCQACGAEFTSASALRMHNRRKHPAP